MERQHFKLEQGYLNIDAEALIFTRSGNWQEANDAKERTAKAVPRRMFRLVFGAALVVVGGLFLSLGEMRSTLNGASIVLAMGLGGLGLFKMYGLLRDDFGRSFRVPFAKVTRLSYVDDHLNIAFLNGAFKEDRLRVKATVDAGLFAEAAWQASRATD